MTTTQRANERRTGGDDAVCFTAGIKGPAFAAGAIHAWLASDRRPPLCAAGISFGAISAAAMQHAMRELEQAEPGNKDPLEVRRWRWFRRYLNRVTNDPLAPLWRALPHPDDLTADREPVNDNSCPVNLRDSQTEARWNYYALMRLGQWLAGLPVRVSSVGRLAVSYVRYKEGYGSPFLVGFLRYWGAAAKVAFLVFVHVFASPQFCRGWAFQNGRPSLLLLQLGSLLRKPLFGWGLWLSVALALAVMAATFGWLAWISVSRAFGPWPSPALWQVPAVGLPLAVAATLAAWRLLPRVAKRLGLKRSLLHDYHTHRALFELFSEGKDPDRPEPAVGNVPMPVLLVAAPLQSIGRDAVQQLYAAADSNLVTALRAAIAIPPLFPPVRIAAGKERAAAGRGPNEVDKWVLSGIGGDEELPRCACLDLVDGSVIRRNPLPALFHFLKHGPGKDTIAHKISSADSKDFRIHIVYNVPVDPLPGDAAERKEHMNIVETGFVSADLASRRDTKLERRQTNFISRLELELRKAGTSRALAVLADDIAPEHEIRFDNPVAPLRDEALELAAHGCRRTLGTLYRKKLKALGKSDVPCHTLLESLHTRRAACISEKTPGLTEVCRHCTRLLTVVPPPAPRASGVQQTFGFAAEPEDGNREFLDRFAHLAGDRPRIAFVASGGVFRGATHIGVLAAMRSMDVRPDLVVGASVGTLMNSALAAMSTLDDENYPKLLDELCHTFFAVDERVALTSTLKGAVRQLGVRARRVPLSPRELSRKFRRGARSDLSIATVGAPAELIDALSMLLLIPYEDTQKIAANFVGGKFAEATERLKTAVMQHTLPRLGIAHCLIGTSLLEPTARRLMGDLPGIAWPKRKPNLDDTQPYHDTGAYPVSFFSTTTSYARKHMIVLGRDEFTPRQSFDFVKAGLSSSAFPAVFSPIQEASVFPGTGVTDELFGDGGMFDNLPFFPAIEILSACQRHALAGGDAAASWAALQRRTIAPDLLIAAALNASPAVVASGDAHGYDDIGSIRKRASVLKNNLKIDAFRFASRKVSLQLGKLTRNSPGEFGLDIDTIVNAAVLKIEPSSEAHLNPTFACVRSLGLKRKRVTMAIADGCFTMLGALTDVRKADSAYGLPAASVHALGERIPVVERRAVPTARAFGRRANCPYYVRDGKAIRCPFGGRGDAVQNVFTICVRDDVHRQKHDAALAVTAGKSP